MHTITIPSIEIFIRHTPTANMLATSVGKIANAASTFAGAGKGSSTGNRRRPVRGRAPRKQRREIELKYEAAQLGKAVADDTPVTIEEAVKAFLAEKQGGNSAGSTVSKYKLTLSRLQEFCDRKGLHFM